MLARRFLNERRKIQLPIVLPSGEAGMRCVARIQDVLRFLDGIHDASVNNARDTLRLTYDPRRITPIRIEGEIKRAGATLAQPFRQITFALDGLELIADAARLERRLADAPGVVWAGVNFAAALAHVAYRDGEGNVTQMLQQCARLGIRAKLLEPPAATEVSAEPSENSNPLQHPASFAWARLTLGALLALGGYLLRSQPQIALCLYVASMLVSGWSLLRSAFWAAREVSFEWSHSVLLAGGGMVALGRPGEAAWTFLALGLGARWQAALLEPMRTTFARLRGFLPASARIRTEQGEKQIPAAEVAVGTTLLVRPGERIPLDGSVVRGASRVQSSPLWARSDDREVGTESKVYAGAQNGNGNLEILVTRRWQDSTLWRTQLAIEESVARHPAFASGREPFASFWSLALVALAVGVAFLPPMLLSGDIMALFPIWAARGCALLLLSSAALFVLPPRFTVASALWQAARKGCLFHDGDALETLANLRALIYEKTGTLTLGTPAVEDTVPFGKMTCNELLYAAAALEEGVEHPLAQAICLEAHRHPPPGIYEVTEREALPGRGVYGVVNGVPALIGSTPLMQEHSFTLTRSMQETLAEIEHSGRTALLLGSQGGLLGIVVVSDRVRPGSAEIVRALKRQGIEHQALLSGDSEGVCKVLAQTVGLEGCEAGLLPEQKQARVQQLSKQFGVVGMIGNDPADATAQATARLHLVLEAQDSPEALATSDLALYHSHWNLLPDMVELSRQTRGQIRRNLLLSGLGMILAIGLALATPAPLFTASLALIGLTAGVLGLARSAEISTISATMEKKTQHAVVAVAPETQETAPEPLFELIFLHDSTVDEEPQPGYVYPQWEPFFVPFFGEPMRFGRQARSSMLPIQLDDEGVSRVHGEFRVENGRPYVADLNSTNGIRYNGSEMTHLIPPKRPIAIRFGDTLRLGRNTRIEIRPPGWAAERGIAPQRVYSLEPTPENAASATASVSPSASTSRVL